MEVHFDRRTAVEDDAPEAESKQFKVIIVGDGAVGKTSLARRFASDTFALEYKQTIGLDFFAEKVALPDGTEVCMQIWDIGGQSIGSKMMQNYLFGAHAIVLVYDITNYDSFQNLEDWLRLVRRAYPDGATMPQLALVGNKMDLAHLRCVTNNAHVGFSRENAMGLSGVVSAKSGSEVHGFFFTLAARLAGKPVMRHEVERSAKAVKAIIVDHQRNDPAYGEGKGPGREPPRCLLS